MPTIFDNQQWEETGERNYYKENLKKMVNDSGIHYNDAFEKLSNQYIPEQYKEKYECGPLESFEVDEKENLKHRIKILEAQLQEIRSKVNKLSWTETKLEKAEEENTKLKERNKILEDENKELNTVYDRSELLDL